jgi:hypothetical protein
MQGEQNVIDDAPYTAEYVPAAHFTHTDADEAPLDDEYVPGLHGIHVDEPF